MSGDLSVGMQPDVTHTLGNDSADFASACAHADRRQRSERGSTRPQSASTASSSSTSSSSSSSANTTLPPGTSVEEAADTVEEGAELIVTPEPCTWSVDQRVAWNERWLARAEAFFNDPLAARYLTPEQLAKARADLKSYREQLTAFKELLAKYRSEGKEPSQEEIQAAFGGMREVRNSLKEMMAVVIGGVADSLYATFDTALDSSAFVDIISFSSDVTNCTTLFQSLLSESGASAFEEARNARFLDALRTEFGRLRESREHPRAEFRP